MSKRNPAVLGVWGQDGTRVVAAEKTWQEPLKWDKAAAKAGERHRVFCASLADIFEDWQGPMVDANGATLHDGRAWHVDKHWIGVNDVYVGRSVIPMDDVRARLFDLIDATPNLDWLILTKRPENIAKMWPGGFRKNVWLLASVSDQQTADAMIPPLMKCRNLASVLGLSMEPLVGPVDLRKIGKTTRGDDIDVLMGTRTTYQYKARDGDECSMGVSCKVYPPTEPIIDFVIVGGESGHGARPMHPQWVRDIRNQCQAAGVPFFFKQWGEFLSYSQAIRMDDFPIAKTDWLYNLGDDDDAAMVGKKAAGRKLDGRTWDEFPKASVS